MVIDYRSLNKVTVKDSYPMPKIQDLMDTLKGARWFTGVDCVQAFHQIPMANERSKDLTTFRGPGGGLFRYRYMPMGLVNAMAIWSRFIDSAMAEHQHDCVLCYADDCLIYTKSESVDDHVRDIQKVFDELRKRGIKIKGSKLKLGCKRMPFLGIIITRDGMIPNPEKTKAIMALPLPKTLKQLRRVLGIFAYYRKFIPKFSKRAKPLYDLTKKGVRKEKGNITLTEEAKDAFDDLKTAITSEPIVLHYPDWSKPFEIHTDASTEAVAAVLTQRIDGVEKVIMYASKSLNELERKYQIYELECLAVVWAAELFRKYIRNNRTIVLTDCAALQWLKSRKMGARVSRWILRLQEFDLDIQHRKRSEANNVDPLTHDQGLGETPYGEQPVERLYNSILHTKAPTEAKIATVTTSALSGRILEVFDEALKQIEEGIWIQKCLTLGLDVKPKPPPLPQPPIQPHPSESKGEPEAAQEGAGQKPFFNCKENKDGTSRDVFIAEQKAATSKDMMFVKERVGKEALHGKEFFETEDKLIMMKFDNNKRTRVVVPDSLRAYVLKMHHNMNLAGHQGRNRTMEQVSFTFYWPGMSKDVAKWVRACLACTRRKTPRPKRAGIRDTKLSTYMDIFGPMIKSDMGNIWVLTIIDHFTKWAVAIPLPRRTSENIAESIFKHWICERGVPNCIVSDRGRELISEGIQQLCAKMGIARVTTAGYNPTGNATVERFHRYLGASLCIIYDKKLPNWDDYLPAVLFSYRASVNEATGYSPFMMEHLREAVLPLQTLFPDLQEKELNEAEYVQRLTGTMEFVFDRARRLQLERSERNRDQMPDNQYKPKFIPGDHLLVWEKAAQETRLQIDEKNLKGHEGGRLPGKLGNPWQGPFRMIRWNGERKCVVDRNGKEAEYNVNRLTKQYPWDPNHLDTSGIIEGAAPPKKQEVRKQTVARRHAILKQTKPQVGDVIVFGFDIARGHKSPFGVVKFWKL